MRARSSYRNKVFSALSFSKCFFLFVLPFALSQLRTIFILITVGTMDKEENDVPVFHLFSLFTALHFSRRRTSVNDILCDRMMAKEEKLKIIGKHHQTHITRTDYVCACISYCLVGYHHKTSHFFCPILFDSLLGSNVLEAIRSKYAAYDSKEASNEIRMLHSGG